MERYGNNNNNNNNITTNNNEKAPNKPHKTLSFQNGTNTKGRKKTAQKQFKSVVNKTRTTHKTSYKVIRNGGEEKKTKNKTNK